MALEKQRPNVARLVGIALSSLTIFSDKVASLLLKEGHLYFIKLVISFAVATTSCWSLV